MKIIILDIDGVHNSELYFRSVDRKKKGWSRFDPKAVKIVTRLVEEFDSKIVISSLWRIAFKKELANELKKDGLIKYLHKDWFSPIIKPGHIGT
ncbi:MAG: HAD domain-containing protein [Ignavibacteriaceae bacterium]